MRVDAASMPADLICRFQCEGTSIGAAALIDLSATGFAVAAPSELLPQPGAVLESFEILLSDRPIWKGEAVVVHANDRRVGGRFTSGVLDLEHLQLGATLERRVALLREQRERLPSEWRAAVADLQRLLQDARFELEETERAEAQDPLRRTEEEAELFTRLRERWGREFVGTLNQLYSMSQSLDARGMNLGQSYATDMLMPLLATCPIHRRAYEKPLGYAGDYRLMELYFAHDIGDGLFGRFLYSVTREYTLVRAVLGREALMRQAVREAVAREGNGPVRILALAAGPAIELRHFIEQSGSLERPVELILLDQDRGALESAHLHLTRLLLGKHLGMLPITVRCLHFSVRQLLKPPTVEDKRVVQNELADLDLVYSAGLYDYLSQTVAARLTALTYSKLRAGGRLFHGNLMVAPDTTWIAEYVLDWPLVYRTPETMRTLADGLLPAPAKVSVVHDQMTEHAVFLDVRKP